MLLGHGSAFLQLSRRRRPCLSFPYAATAITSHQVSQKGEITRVVFDHLRVSYSLRLPSNSTSSRTNKGNPQPPHSTGIHPKNTKTPPASPGCASALPGDVGDDQARLCTCFRWCPPPGSPMGLPGRFCDCSSRGTSGYTSAARVFCARSIGYYILCVLAPLYT